MRNPSRITRRKAGALLLGLAAAGTASAQAYPSRPIRFVVGFAAGSTTDVVARIVAAHVGAKLGQNVVVENKPGANGMLAAVDVARAAPDGHAVYFTSSSTITINPLLYKKIQYDPVRDFAPVTLVVSAPFVLVVNPDKNVGGPLNNIGDLVKLARSKPGELTFGSAGLGNLSHFTMELLMNRAGIKLNHIPYKAASQAQAALLAKEIDMEFDTPSVIPQLRAGKLKAIAVSTPQRWRDLPDVPTIGEQGLPGFDTAFWLGALVPVQTPAAVVRTLHQAIASANDDPAVRASLLRHGNLELLDPDSFSARVKNELKINGDINARVKVELD